MWYILQNTSKRIYTRQCKSKKRKKREINKQESRTRWNQETNGGGGVIQIGKKVCQTPGASEEKSQLQYTSDGPGRRQQFHRTTNSKNQKKNTLTEVQDERRFINTSTEKATFWKHFSQWIGRNPVIPQLKEKQ